MRLKQWYINWWITRIKRKFKKKYQEKYNRDLRKAQEDYAKKLLAETDRRNVDLDIQQKNYEKILVNKDKEINKILESGNKQTEEARVQTEIFWKNIVAERDAVIKELQKEKINNRHNVLTIKEREEDLNTSLDDIEISCKTAEHHMTKTLQALKVVIKNGKKYFNTHKPVEELENVFKEE